MDEDLPDRVTGHRQQSEGVVDPALREFFAELNAANTRQATGTRLETRATTNSKLITLRGLGGAALIFVVIAAASVLVGAVFVYVMDASGLTKKMLKREENISKLEKTFGGDVARLRSKLIYALNSPDSGTNMQGKDRSELLEHRNEVAQEARSLLDEVERFWGKKNSRSLDELLNLHKKVIAMTAELEDIVETAR